MNNVEAFNASSSTKRHAAQLDNTDARAPAHRYSFKDVDALAAACATRSTAECLRFMHANKSDYMQPDVSRGHRHLIHMFWSGPLKPHPLLVVKSFVFTQNLAKTRLVFWADNVDDLGPLQSIVDLFPHAIEVRDWSAAVEIAKLDELMVAHGREPTQLSHHIKGDTPVEYSDSVRFIVLTLYGGIYVDADTLLLRDFEPLFDVEFAYKWSFLNASNTAVIGLHKHSEYGMDMHSRGLDYFPQRIIADRIRVLPTAWFDPLWLANDGVEPAMSRDDGKALATFRDLFEVVDDERLASLFEGAFACHWHNKWGLQWKARSYIGWWDKMADFYVKSKM
jgi:hypothetical protein